MDTEKFVIRWIFRSNCIKNCI